MITFISSVLFLIAGFVLYGTFVERFFCVNEKSKTPALIRNDGVDFIPMPTWKVFTIEFLNIAGLGPIFGAVLGAMYGPMAYLWIVFGCIFIGAVHDYFSGMLSVRNDGASIPEIIGKYLGNGFRVFIRIFSLLLLIFVGVAFVTGPAGLLSSFSGGGYNYWLYAVFAYYLLATLFPINEIIGRIYPFFGAALLIMALLVGGAIIIRGVGGELNITELRFYGFSNFHNNPAQNILYPMMFIVISCGALSGFHSTQAPMMARCMKNEKHGRYVFYGAMIAEGIVAIIWATAAMNFFGGPQELNETMQIKGHNPAWVVNEISNTWLGRVGALFAIIGVIACPITTGDTAFRSARLTIADIFNIDQSSIIKRLWISIPLFVLGFALSQIEFETIWKYLGLSNQVLAVVVLWASAAYLVKVNKPHWMLSLPAFFMTTICITYLMVAPVSQGGLSLNITNGYIIGLVFGIIAYFWFFYSKKHIKD